MQPFEQRFVLLPGRDLWKRRTVGGFLESLALHLKICASINLSCLHIDVAEEVADDFAAQEPHTFAGDNVHPSAIIVRLADSGRVACRRVQDDRGYYHVDTGAA